MLLFWQSHTLRAWICGNIRCFLAVADAGSITEAAKALHQSQPPLSMAMAKLETEPCLTLLDRMPRGVALTPAGRHLQAACRRLIAEEQLLSATSRAMGEGSKGNWESEPRPWGCGGS